MVEPVLPGASEFRCCCSCRQLQRRFSSWEQMVAAAALLQEGLPPKASKELLGLLIEDGPPKVYPMLLLGRFGWGVVRVCHRGLSVHVYPPSWFPSLKSVIVEGHAEVRSKSAAHVVLS